MRSFMLFPPNKVVAYLDWKAQEVAVAAVNSGDLQLMHDYSGDIYHALAVMCGLTDDPDIAHWKKTQKPMRDRMKPLQLGINYGMGVPSLCERPGPSSTDCQRDHRTAQAPLSTLLGGEGEAR